MSAIADRVGLSQPALSQRFGSKRQLLLRAFVPQSLPAWLSRLESGPDDRPFEQQLEALAIEAMVVLQEAIPAIMTLRTAGLDALRTLADDEPLPHEHVRRTVAGFFARCVDQGLVRPADPEHIAHAFIGGLQAHVLSAYVDRRDEPPEEARRHAVAVVHLLVRGLKPEDDP